MKAFLVAGKLIQRHCTAPLLRSFPLFSKERDTYIQNVRKTPLKKVCFWRRYRIYIKFLTKVEADKPAEKPVEFLEGRLLYSIVQTNALPSLIYTVYSVCNGTVILLHVKCWYSLYINHRTLDRKLDD